MGQWRGAIRRRFDDVHEATVEYATASDNKRHLEVPGPPITQEHAHRGRDGRGDPVSIGGGRPMRRRASIFWLRGSVWYPTSWFFFHQGDVVDEPELLDLVESW